MDPNTFENQFLGDFSNWFPEQPKACSSKSHGCSSADLFLHTTTL